MKQQKAKKSPEQRQSEVDHLMDQFLELGFPLELPGTQEFIKITKDFVQHGQSASGTIKFPEYHRVMEYIFSMQPHVVSRVNITSTIKKPKHLANTPMPKSVDLVTV